MAERVILEVRMDGGRLVVDATQVSRGLDRIGREARQAEGRVGLLGRGLGSLKGLLLGVVAPVLSFAGAVRVLSRAVTEAGTAAIVERRLERALRNLGDASPQAVDGLKRVAAQLQATTNFADDAVLTAAQLLATFRSVGGAEGIGMLLPRLADMAAGVARATGETMDLNQVAQLLGRAIEGQVTSLRRVGVSFTDAEAEALKLATGMDRVRLLSEILDRNFKGLAGAGADPFIILKNAAEELYEVLGEELYVVLKDVALELARIARSEGFLAFVRRAGRAVADFVENLVDLGGAFGQLGRDALDLERALGELGDAFYDADEGAREAQGGLLGVTFTTEDLTDKVEAAARQVRALGNALRAIASFDFRTMFRGLDSLGRTMFGGERDVTGSRSPDGPWWLRPTAGIRPPSTVSGAPEAPPAGPPGGGGGGGGSSRSDAAAAREAERKAEALLEEAQALEELLKLWGELQAARAGKGPGIAPAGPTVLDEIKADARDLIDVTIPELEERIVTGTSNIMGQLAGLANVYGESVAMSLDTLSDAFYSFFEASGRRNRAALIAFKAAAIAETIISTYTAATQMLKPSVGGPPPLNYINAGAVVLAGLANLARIRAVGTGGGAGGGSGAGGGGAAGTSSVAAAYGGGRFGATPSTPAPVVNNSVNVSPPAIVVHMDKEGVWSASQDGRQLYVRTRGGDQA